MPIVHLNGFATVPVSGDYIALQWGGSGTLTWTRQPSRGGGYALRATNSSSSVTTNYIGSLLIPPMNAFSIGCALRHTTAMPVAGDIIGLAVSTGAVSRVGVPSGYSVALVAAASTSAWVITDPTVTTLGWHWWNFTYNLSATTGFFRAYRDGTLVAEQQPDTMPSTGTTVTSISLNLGNSNDLASGVDIADLVIRNDTTLIPDSRVDVLFPTGNGATSDWVGSDGDSTDNYLLVDDAPTVDMADYVGANAVGATDLYTFSDLPYTPISIDAVQVSAVSSKSDAGAKTMCVLVNDTESTPAVDTGGSKTVYGVYTTNPSGGAAWNKAAVDAITAGVRIKS